MFNTIGNFISSNAKGIRSSEKRLKIFECLKNNIHDNSFVFLQEIHSLAQDKKKWKDDFKNPLFFSHGSKNSLGVAIGFYGLKSLFKIDKKSDENGRILIINAKLNDEKFLHLNIYNLNRGLNKLKHYIIRKIYSETSTTFRIKE